jgi:hypothetical protein
VVRGHECQVLVGFIRIGLRPLGFGEHRVHLGAYQLDEGCLSSSGGNASPLSQLPGRCQSRCLSLTGTLARVGRIRHYRVNGGGRPSMLTRLRLYSRIVW